MPFELSPQRVLIPLEMCDVTTARFPARSCSIRINPELGAQMRPFARLHRLRALRRPPWQGITLLACFFAPFHGCLSTRSIQELHVPDSFRSPPRLVTPEPVAPAGSRNSHIALQLSLPVGTAEGFPPFASLGIKELGQSTIQEAHLGIQPDLPFLPDGLFLIWMPPDHRSGSAATPTSPCGLIGLG